MLRTHRPVGRPGFTLIELLVVIAIIAVLAALTLAGVQRVRETSRTVQVRADMTGLDTALGEFRAKMKRPVPSFGGGAHGTFRLRSSYQTAAGAFIPPFTDTSPEVVILRGMFGRINLADTGLRAPDYTQTPPAPFDPRPALDPQYEVLLDPNQCMVFFLSGGSFTGYTGFATDPQQPFRAPATSTDGRLHGGRFFEFKSDRMLPPNKYNTRYVTNPGSYQRFANDTGDGNKEPWFVDIYRSNTGTPYLYLASFNTSNNFPFDPGFHYPLDTTVQATCRQPLEIGPWGGPNKASYPASDTDMQVPRNPTPFRDSTPIDQTRVTSGVMPPNAKFLSSDKWQIWCAGPNQVFGNGGDYRTKYEATTAPLGTGDFYVDNRPGGDDFVNFQSTKMGSEN